MARHQSLLPREHGAYAELAFPLLSGLTLGRPSWTAACLAAAAVSFFLLHEPVAVLIGVRGARLKQAWSTRARRRITWLAILGVGSGTAAMVMAQPEVRLAALIPFGAGAALLPAFLSGRLKTIMSEVFVIVALSTMVLPLGISGGAARSLALAASAVWFLTFSLGTLAVHAIKARSGKSPASMWAVVATPLLSVVVVVLALHAARSGWLPLTVSLALLLGGLVGLALSVIRIHPRHLKLVGWALVGSNLITLVLLATA